MTREMTADVREYAELMAEYERAGEQAKVGGLISDMRRRYSEYDVNRAFDLARELAAANEPTGDDDDTPPYEWGTPVTAPPAAPVVDNPADTPPYEWGTPVTAPPAAPVVDNPDGLAMLDELALVESGILANQLAHAAPAFTMDEWVRVADRLPHGGPGATLYLVIHDAVQRHAKHPDHVIRLHGLWAEQRDMVAAAAGDAGVRS